MTEIIELFGLGLSGLKQHFPASRHAAPSIGLGDDRDIAAVTIASCGPEW
jgi:hypothetical protein